MLICICLCAFDLGSLCAWKAEHGLANWMALELRHDRVHQIFSRLPAAAVLYISLERFVSCQAKIANQLGEFQR